MFSSHTEWFRRAKFGMFIHWGLYSVPAGIFEGREIAGYGEWIMHNGNIRPKEYENYASDFCPMKFNAREWARLAKAAGMRYIVVTSKHHDGFSMFGTKVNEYNVVDCTPWKRDPLAELEVACKEAGIKFGLYYSILDWHHPHANKEGADVGYIPEMKEQLRELVVNYDPALLWFDGEWVDWWTSEKGKDLERFLRALKPDLVINNRIGKRLRTDGDYDTPEQEIPGEPLGNRLWETCMTMNETWGYKKNDLSWKTPMGVLRRLAEIAGKGGNLLLNVGPTGEGVIPECSAKILEEVGRWLELNGEAIYGTSAYAVLDWGAVTEKQGRLYAIISEPPLEPDLSIPVRKPARKAYSLRSGHEIERMSDDGREVLMRVPSFGRESHASVVVIE